MRTKYEITKDIDPDELIPELKKRIKELDFVIKEPEIKVLDTTLNTYIIAIDTFCKGTYEEPPRSEIIKLTSSPPWRGESSPHRFALTSLI